MTWETYHAATLRQLPRGSRLDTRPGGIAVTLACKDGHEDVIEFGKMLPATGIYKALQQRGWKFPGSRCICPDHANSNRKEGKVTQMAEALKAAQATKQISTNGEGATPATTASTPAKHAKRDALRWLDESFDTVAGRYKDGMSDAKIAEETGLSVKAIAELRAEFGYDMKTPPEIVQMIEDAKAVRGLLVRLHREADEKLTALEQRLAAYEVKG